MSMNSAEVAQDFVVEPSGDLPFSLADDVTSVEEIYERFIQGYYHDIDTLVNHINWLFNKAIKERCKNPLARKYLELYQTHVTTHLKNKQNSFNEKWRDYFHGKFNENSQRFVRMNDPSWRNDKPPATVAKRQYHSLENYKQVISQQKL